MKSQVRTCAAFGRLCPHGISDMDGDRHGLPAVCNLFEAYNPQHELN